MKPCIMIAAAALLVAPSAMAQTDRTKEESDTAVVLYGRACRASSDQDWIQVCSAAIALAQKEAQAQKPKLPAEKKPE